VITLIELANFKCFRDLKLPVSPLTLLSGSNASGKSSVLQALVLLHQTMREHEWSTRLLLNGSSIRLGTVADVVDKVHGRHSLELGIVDGDGSYKWCFSDERSAISMGIDSVFVGGQAHDRPETLRYLLPHVPGTPTKTIARQLRQLTYITAERIGPREIYPLEDRQAATVVGPAGEHAVSVLHWGRDEDVVAELVLPTAPGTRLKQVEARMGLFFPGCGLDVQQVPQANSVTLGLRTSPDTDFHRPVHVGFGLTQVLPIVIAALSAAKGDLLLVENPEVHLHPAGQSLMGQFLAAVAHAGVQVIVETHSDHVLNGVRRAVKTAVLPSEHVAIHYFRARPAGENQVESPQINVNGEIDSWPEGFFDQFDRDSSFFAGWGQ